MIRKRLISIALTAAVVLTMGFASIGVGLAASGGIEYTNSAHGFCLTLPANWAGLYRVEERPNGASFINTRNENAGYGGFVLGIYVSDNTDPVEWGYRELTRSGGKYYYAATPSDVQFNYNNESLRNEYATMERDTDAVFASFRLLTGRLTASPTAATVLVNGTNVAFDAYHIEGNNYFKLRDLAYSINGTEKQFQVYWDAGNNAISLTSGQAYTSVGGEMAGRGSGSEAAEPTAARVFVNGQAVQLKAYHINGNNYFMLRDIGEALNFGVTWDGPNNRIIVSTPESYDPGSIPDYASMYSNTRLGSAKYLEGRNVIVSIFVSFENTVWNAQDAGVVAERLSVTKGFLENEVNNYGKNLDFICDFVSNPDLRYDMKYEGELFQYPVDFVLTEDDVKLYTATNEYLDDFIENNIPYLALADKYDTDSIAYVFVVKEWYAFKYALSYGDGGPQNRYNEKIVMTFAAGVSPVDYAHEILHVFGAVDLYFSNEAQGVSEALVEYTSHTYPSDVMYDIYYFLEATYYDKIIQTISPITAYCLGLLSDIPELTQFPQLRRAYPAVYTDQSRAA